MCMCVSLCCVHVCICACLHSFMGFPGGSSGKEPACQCRRNEMQVRSLGQEDPLEEGMATHSSVQEPGELWSIGSQRVRCD